MAKEFDIGKIAELARVDLDTKEKDKLSNDLESIISYVKKLEVLNTKNVEPTSHVLPLTDVFRKDEVKTQKIRDEFLKHAPNRQGDFFKVPKVIEET